MKQNPPQHGPNRFQSYFKTHSNVLQQFIDKGFVGQDTLELSGFGRSLYIIGELGCSGEIVVNVDKKLEILDPPSVQDPLIQTVYYSYNVFVRHSGNVFRYDNQDEDFGFREGHDDEHHKHIFDFNTGEEIAGSPIWIGASNWPTLGKVIAEIEQWYWLNKHKLAHPDRYPELGLR